MVVILLNYHSSSLSPLDLNNPVATTFPPQLLRALTLLTKAAIAVSEDRSTKWRQEVHTCAMTGYNVGVETMRLFRNQHRCQKLRGFLFNHDDTSCITIGPITSCDI